MRKKVKKAAKATRSTKATKATRNTATRKAAPRAGRAATTTLADTMERSFRDIPAKLIAQCRKELDTLKQQEKKLQNELVRAQTQKKTALQQQNTLNAKIKTKSTPTNRKQLAKVSKGLTGHTKTITELTGKLSKLKLQASTVNNKQGKFAAIGKQLSSLDREWALKAREAAQKINAAASAAANKTNKKKATRKPKTTVSPAAAPASSGNTMHENQTTSFSINRETEVTE